MKKILFTVLATFTLLSTNAQKKRDVKDINYRDPHATIDVSEWTHIKREATAKAQFMTLSEKEDMFQKFFYLTYTKGIMMYEIRKLMNITAKQRITSDQK